MRPVTKVYLYDDEEKFFGEGPFLLLKGIENSGSLRASAQQIGVSYSKALSIIKRAETVLGFPLTERSIGGTGGGGSCLTIRGKQFLNRYERYNLMCQEKNLALFRHFWDQPGMAQTAIVSAVTLLISFRHIHQIRPYITKHVITPFRPSRSQSARWLLLDIASNVLR